MISQIQNSITIIYGLLSAFDKKNHKSHHPTAKDEMIVK